MSYATDHAGALADVRAAGASVVFFRSSASLEGADGRLASAPASDGVFGYATEEETGQPEEYVAFGLTIGEGPRLFTVLEQYGAEVPIGGTALFGGKTYRVAAVKPYRPDGVVLFSSVFLAR